MSYSTERVFRVRTTPDRILERSDRRYSWDITNISGNTIYYMRGPRGRDMAVAGEAQGVPIANNAADGYDEEDACDEVWVIAAVAGDVIIGETYLSVPWPEYRRGGSGSRHIGESPHH